MNFVTHWKNSYKLTKKLPTAYLFAGPEGSGKREAAEVMVRTLLGRGEHHPDLIRIVPDKSSPKVEKRSIRIEAIRDLTRRLSLKPFEGDRIVVIIEEAEKMPEAAANALLKTLEEPPGYVLLILITASPERLLPTIRSRCQRVTFRIGDAETGQRLHGTFLEWQGKILSLFQDQDRPFSAASRLAEEISREPDRLPSLFELLKGIWHDLAVSRETGAEGHLLLPEAAAIIGGKGRSREAERIFGEIDLIHETERAIEGNVNKTLALERLFVKLISS